MRINSKVDDELYYTKTPYYIAMHRNGDYMRIKYPEIPEVSKKFIPEVRAELMSFWEQRHPTINCAYCGKVFVVDRSNQKCCCKKCYNKYHNLLNRKRYNEKRAEANKTKTLDIKIKEAAAMGLSYGKYQALKTLETIEKVQI